MRALLDALNGVITVDQGLFRLAYGVVGCLYAAVKDCRDLPLVRAANEVTKSAFLPLLVGEETYLMSTR